MNKQKSLKMIAKSGQGNWSSYPHLGFMFAFCGKAENCEVKQLTSFESCRESLICRVFDKEVYKIPTNRLRCLVRTIATNSAEVACNKFEKQTKAGLRILNIMEKRHGWLLTKMSNVETSSIRASDGCQNRTVFTKMLVGPAKWVKSPHMLSLFFLLYRLGTKHPNFLGVLNYKEFKKACKDYTSGSAVSGDKRSVRNTILFWDPLMANFDEMFKGLSLQNNFDKNNYEEDLYYHEGILRLCAFQTKNAKISERFVALASEVRGAKIPKSKKKQAGL